MEQEIKIYTNICKQILQRVVWYTGTFHWLWLALGREEIGTPSFIWNGLWGSTDRFWIISLALLAVGEEDEPSSSILVCRRRLTASSACWNLAQKARNLGGPASRLSGKGDLGGGKKLPGDRGPTKVAQQGGLALGAPWRKGQAGARRWALAQKPQRRGKGPLGSSFGAWGPLKGPPGGATNFTSGGRAPLNPGNKEPQSPGLKKGPSHGGGAQPGGAPRGRPPERSPPRGKRALPSLGDAGF